MRRAILALALAAPAIAAGQTVDPFRPRVPIPGNIGSPRDSAKALHHGVFIEAIGVGGLGSLSYEHRFGRAAMAQVGFTKWSTRLGPGRARTGGLASIMRQIHLFDWEGSAVSFESGAGFTAGWRKADEYATHSFESIADSTTPPDSLSTSTNRRGRYASFNGLFGVRVSAERTHDITWRIGWVPVFAWRDVPGEPRWRGTLALSAGYTW